MTYCRDVIDLLTYDTLTRARGVGNKHFRVSADSDARTLHGHVVGDAFYDNRSRVSR